MTQLMIDKEISMRWLSALTAPLLMLLILRPPVAIADFCQADINSDGKIDTGDLEIMQAELYRDNCFMVPCRSDLNGDGKVSGKDAETLIAAFGEQNCFSEKRGIPGEQTDMLYIGQKTEFDSAEEEDVAEGIELPENRFIDNGDGTITDPKTGLMWTKNADPYGDTLLFHQALDYIEAMNEGHYANFSYTDWRLPDWRELRSLIDYTKLMKHGHTLPLGHPFNNVQPLNFNRDPSYMSTSNHSWFVSLYCRLVGHNASSCYGFVWPVRGKQ